LTTLQEAEAIVAPAASSTGKLMVDFDNRLNPAIVQIRDAIAAGEIGNPIHGDARLSNTTFVPLKMLGRASKSSALWFLGSHVVDALRLVLADEVTRVFSVSRRGVLSGRGVETEDVHLSTIEFSTGTAIIMENSWILSPDKPMTYDLKLKFVGDKGQIRADPSHNGAVRRLTGNGLKYSYLLGITPTGESRIGGFVLEAIARFVDAVLDGAPPPRQCRRRTPNSARTRGDRTVSGIGPARGSLREDARREVGSKGIWICELTVQLRIGG
jgi:predicted dehydrogenase